MGSGYAKMKKQRKQLEEQFAKMQEEMKTSTYEGQAGNGLVKICVNGEKEIKDISIKPECVDPEDVEGLQDLIIGAFQDATSKIKDNSSMDMGGLGGLFS